MTRPPQVFPLFIAFLPELLIDVIGVRFAQDSPNASWSEYQVQHGGVLKGGGNYPALPGPLMSVARDIASAGSDFFNNMGDTFKKTYQDLKTLYDNGTYPPRLSHLGLSESCYHLLSPHFLSLPSPPLFPILSSPRISPY